MIYKGAVIKTLALNLEEPPIDMVINSHRIVLVESGNHLRSFSKITLEEIDNQPIPEQIKEEVEQEEEESKGYGAYRIASCDNKHLFIHTRKFILLFNVRKLESTPMHVLQYSGTKGNDTYHATVRKINGWWFNVMLSMNFIHFISVVDGKLERSHTFKYRENNSEVAFGRLFGCLTSPTSDKMIFFGEFDAKFILRIKFF